MSGSEVVLQNRNLSLQDSAIPLLAPPQSCMHPTRPAARGWRLSAVTGLSRRWGRGSETGTCLGQHPLGYRGRQSVMSPVVLRSAVLTNHWAPHRTWRGSAESAPHQPEDQPYQGWQAAGRQGHEEMRWPGWWWLRWHSQSQWGSLKHRGPRPTLWEVGVHKQMTFPVGLMGWWALHLRIQNPSPSLWRSGSLFGSAVTPIKPKGERKNWQIRYYQKDESLPQLPHVHRTAFPETEAGVVWATGCRL